MKVILNYDELTGNITDSKGVYLFMYGGLSYDSVDDMTSIDEMIKLKNAGFTAQEIIEMRKAGL